MSERLAERRVPFFRFDTAEFPMSATLTGRLDAGGLRGSLRAGGREIAVEDVRSVWHRWPAAFELPEAMTPVERRFAHAEAEMGAGGLLRCLGGLWVNHPDRVSAARYKPAQLQLAVECGLQVPRTLVTNDPDAVASFLEECHGRACYKTLSRPTVVDHERSAHGIIYTSLVREDDGLSLQRVRNTACLFQEYVDKRVELRVTIVGDDVFTAEIHSQSAPESAVDFRRGYDFLTYAVHELPADLTARCLEITRRLGLVFAAIDMILTPDGRYVFLEVNPTGQWMWIEDATGLPVTGALVSLLAA